jgi:hypothetical protein
MVFPNFSWYVFGLRGVPLNRRPEFAQGDALPVDGNSLRRFDRRFPLAREKPLFPVDGPCALPLFSTRQVSMAIGSENEKSR